MVMIGIAEGWNLADSVVVRSVKRISYITRLSGKYKIRVGEILCISGEFLSISRLCITFT